MKTVLEKILLGRILLGLSKLVYLLLQPIVWVVVKIYQYCRMIIRLALTRTISYARDQWHELRHYNPSETEHELGHSLAQDMSDPWKRIPLTLISLVCGTPLIAVLFLTLGFGIPAFAILAAHKFTYPDHSLALPYQLTPENIAAVSKMTEAQKSNLVTGAIIHQLQAELDSNLGWLPNDLGGYSPLAWSQGPLDNRVNCQLGVVFATRKILESWSLETSKFGLNDTESTDLVTATSRGLSQEPDSWLIPAVEWRYREAIDLVQAYQRKVLAGTATTNVTKGNLADVLQAIREKVLGEAVGHVNVRSTEMSWLDIDDRVYYAECASVVVRDTMAAIRLAYADELRITNATVNIDSGISSLTALAQFNPWVNFAGEGDSMLPNHPTKVTKYMNDALSRFLEGHDALNGKS